MKCFVLSLFFVLFSLFCSNNSFAMAERCSAEERLVHLSLLTGAAGGAALLLKTCSEALQEEYTLNALYRFDVISYLALTLGCSVGELLLLLYSNGFFQKSVLQSMVKKYHDKQKKE